MTSITKKISKFAINISIDQLPKTTLAYAKLSIIDWCSVAYAGKNERVSKIVSKLSTNNKGIKESRLINNGKLVNAESAALANGTLGHALDYDDTHFLHIGHTSAVIMPVILALGEKYNLTLKELILAYIIGAETTVRIGYLLGKSHYDAGFHQTSTSGAFGAVASASRIINFTETQTTHALGLISSQASGLKAQFGTMGKPFHAGMAASQAIQTVKLISLGFKSNPNSLEEKQGFLITHHWNGTVPNKSKYNWGKLFLFTNVNYKFYACCHGLHATLEAIKLITEKYKIEAKSINKITIKTNPAWLNVCNIETPKTGLETKFSYKAVVSMLLNGINMTDPKSYTDNICSNKKIINTMNKIMVESNSELSATKSDVKVYYNDVYIKSSFDISKKTHFKLIEKKVHKKALLLLGKNKYYKIIDIIQSNEIKNIKNITKIMSS